MNDSASDMVNKASTQDEVTHSTGKKDTNFSPSSNLSGVANLESHEKDAVKDSSAKVEDYPSGLRFSLIAFSLNIGIFLLTLDGTVIATAMPQISDEFHSLKDIGWYSSVYFMTLCISQPLYGKLNSRYAIRWSYLCAMVLFAVGSVVCGAAPNSPALIVGCAIAGMGSSGILVGTFSLIPYLVSPSRRPIFTGLIGMTLGLGTALGPLIGGALTLNVSWRWCFYINLPIGAASTIIFILFVRPPKRSTDKITSWKDFVEALDLVGLAALMPAIICLLLALQWGGLVYPWSSGRIIALLVLFGLLSLAFVGIEFMQGERAMLPPRVFCQRSIVFASLFSFCTSGASFALIYYVPVWFQAIKGASPLDSGVMNLPMVIATTIFSLVGGLGITLVGYYTPFMIASSILSAVGSGLLITFQPDTGHAKWIGYQVLYGFGVGLSRQTPLIAVQNVLPIVDVSIGSGMIMFMQTLASAVFISVTETLFINELTNGVAGLGISGLSGQPLLEGGVTTLGQNLNQAAQTQLLSIYNNALVHSWRVAVAVSSISIIGALLIEHKEIQGKRVKNNALVMVEEKGSQ
ncbi:hypothetical protein MMC17_002080 [Xylographa soralifera]|nr:hypothetical protein [Xylographa soralifera]